MPTRLVALLLFLGIYSGWLVVRALRTRGWPSARAIVLSSEPSSGWSIASLPPDGEPLPNFESTHKVRLRFEANGVLQEVIVHLAGKHGSEVTVFYDPAAPTRVTLRPGIRILHLWPAILGLLVFTAFMFCGCS